MIFLSIWLEKFALVRYTRFVAYFGTLSSSLRSLITGRNESISTNSVNRFLILRALKNEYITSISTELTATVNQPPWMNLLRLATKKLPSMIMYVTNRAIIHTRATRFKVK